MGKSGVRSVEPRGADLVVRALRNAGTRHVFSLSGNQIMPIYDALVDGDINLYHVRHEAAAVHMADAWGRLTGSPGVALVTAGPGFANTLSALYVARMAESPVVLISGSSANVGGGAGGLPGDAAGGHGRTRHEGVVDGIQHLGAGRRGRAGV